MKLIDEIREKASVLNRAVALPEAGDVRMLYASREMVDKKIAKPILVGNKDETQKLAQSEDISLSGIEIVDPADSADLGDFASEYYEMRKTKGMTPDAALETMRDPLHYAAMMLRRDIVSAAVAGAQNTTGDVLRAAIRVVGTVPGVTTVSSCFLMVLPEFLGQKEKVIVFGDCAVVPQPDAKQLADIAIMTARTAKLVAGIDPIVAMLSFSTKGSAKHPDADKVLAALEIIREQAPDLVVDGELQLDAAVIPTVGKKKAPGSTVAGNANVIIFPDLDAGNIGYKLVQRFANAEAVGPVMGGLAKPYNDLSRGCSVDDIINVSAIAILNSVKA